MTTIEYFVPKDCFLFEISLNSEYRYVYLALFANICKHLLTQRSIAGRGAGQSVNGKRKSSSLKLSTVSGGGSGSPGGTKIPGSFN